MSKSAKNDNRITPKNDNRPATARRPRGRHPWADAIDGIDYGPAVAAVGDLAAWAFDLAAADVADWPEGRRRVRTARRFVLDRLRGKPARSAPIEDVVFTAGLLARIFEADVGLDLSDIVAVLDRLGLPTDMVPMVPRVQPSVARSIQPDVVPIRPRPVVVRTVTTCCDECGAPRFRNAA